jgi:hypothetical protein
MVVEFKKGHNNSRHIDELKLDENEARDFVNIFLKPEIDRHLSAIKMCKRQIEQWRENNVVRTAYDSSIRGHLQDVHETQKTIDSLKNKFGWDGEI